jgi:hypothetical protein
VEARKVKEKNESFLQLFRSINENRVHLGPRLACLPLPQNHRSGGMAARKMALRFLTEKPLDFAVKI